MKLNKTILAGINLSPLDDKIIAFTKLLKGILDPENIIFYHVKSSAEGDDQAIEANVRKKINQGFASVLTEKETFLFESGDAQKLLVKKSEEKDIDLMVLGRKVSENNNILTNDLINTAKSSLFLIPEHASEKISNITIGIDFSEESHHSLDTAVNIARHTGAEIHCVNIYHVPSGYHTSGKDYDEYAEIMKQNAIKASEKFQKKYQYNIPLNFEFLLDDDSDPADKLYEYAKTINADLICLGSKGLDNIAGLFFDTTTEKIVEVSTKIPTLVIKGKRKNRSLIDAIREL